MWLGVVMRLFSQRQGIEKVEDKIQLNSISAGLRTQLWNGLIIYYLTYIKDRYINKDSETEHLIEQLWLFYFKKDVFLIPSWGNDAIDEVKAYFISCPWNKVFDVIEFIMVKHPNANCTKGFIQYCNEVLEQDHSGYRIIEKVFVPITSREELKEINESLQSPLKSVKTHIERALELLSDKKDPDYRNSIKESISAVEALCKIISKKDNATLTDALKEIEKTKTIDLHSALKSAFEKMYGYTSDEGGIRHSLTEEDSNSFEDAKFMLISCSAFINYLTIKAKKANIKL